MKRGILAAALLLAVAIILSACGGKDSASKSKAQGNSGNESAKIIFLELGSSTCIPCKQMQPVMKAIESRYKGQVNVVFHDVMKDRSISQRYGIKLIPTQVFLDQSGKELMRHEGFFAEAEIDKFLKSQGLVPLN
ncbi:thioredoxin [candidate division KSB1 bacterium]|nr:MAG: thioredoxin [candidate division KSB1 bacterium]